MTKETMLGHKMKQSFSMKKCCNLCGFPVDMPRKPVILDNSPLSLIEADDNTCLSCGHQKDGTTIPVVYEFWQKLANHFIKEREDLIKFLNHYEFLTSEQRREVCVELPRFMMPNYNSVAMDGMDADTLEPFSWTVVYNEVINGTKLSRVMVRDIDWKRIENDK